MNHNREKLFEFINSHQLAVLSTVTSDFLPESSLVGIAVNETLEIFFGTSNTSRKWTNLQKNSKVSLVIGWEKGQTVQYEGEAKELSESERTEALKTMFASKPSLAKYVTQKEAAMFKISPIWMRLTDASHDPFNQIELKI